MYHGLEKIRLILVGDICYPSIEHPLFTKGCCAVSARDVETRGPQLQRKM